MALNRMKLVNQAELRRQVAGRARVSREFLAALERRMKAVLGAALDRLEQDEDKTLSQKHLETQTADVLLPLGLRHRLLPVRHGGGAV